MARLNDLGEGKLEAPKLRPELVIIKPGHNYRDMNSPATRAHIEWLKTSIREEGVKNPISVTFAEGKVYLESGECRLTAAQELRAEGWDGYIPCIAIRGDEATVLAKSIIDNTALPPTLLELGSALQRLLDYGWEMEKVAKCVPPSLASDPAQALQLAGKALTLNSAPLEVKQAVKEGVDGVQVSPGLAVALTKKNPLQAAQKIKEAAQEAKSKGKKVARRPKGAGVATKRKEQEKASARELLEAADKMADLALNDDVMWESVARAARAYNKLRGR